MLCNLCTVVLYSRFYAPWYKSTIKYYESTTSTTKFTSTGKCSCSRNARVFKKSSLCIVFLIKKKTTKVSLYHYIKNEGNHRKEEEKLFRAAKSEEIKLNQKINSNKDA